MSVSCQSYILHTILKCSVTVHKCWFSFLLYKGNPNGNITLSGYKLSHAFSPVDLQPLHMYSTWLQVYIDIDTHDISVPK